MLGFPQASQEPFGPREGALYPQFPRCLAVSSGFTVDPVAPGTTSHSGSNGRAGCQQKTEYFRENKFQSCPRKLERCAGMHLATPSGAVLRLFSRLHVSLSPQNVQAIYLLQ